jgi:hypothetical protein
MQIQIEVSDDVIRSVVAGSKIGYWGLATHWDPELMTLAVCECPGNGYEPKDWSAGKHSLATGLGILAMKYPRHFADIMSGKWDACSGDALIQCALFGELRYG